MIHITYTLDRSAHHGIGLFTAENLRKGQLIYTASPTLDVNISSEVFDSLSEEEKKEIRWWGYFNARSGKWHVDFDVSKFINHSYDPNVTQDRSHADASLVALRDISSGEELTQDYREFESSEDVKRRGIPELK